MAPLTFVRGFFAQDNETVDTFDAAISTRMGLLEGKTWADVNELINRSQTHGPKVKLILLLRHGEGLHNADKARVGDQAWENEFQFLPEYIDAPLTALGVTQSKAAAYLLEEQLATGGELQLERVIVSPLDRTLETYAHVFANLTQLPATAMEITRETLGVCPCDQRKAMRDKVINYPQVDFSGIKDEEDVLWTAEHRESDTEIEVRALKFLNEVYWNHQDDRITVVSHSGFSRACFRALGHRHYRPQNAEFIPLLLTTEPAPSFTK